jgi:hypothetical protein
MPREFDESGQFKTTTTLDDVLAAFDEIENAVVSTGEIAEAAECGRESARQKLTTLYEQDRVNRKKTGQSLVWWRLPPEDAEERPDRRLRRLSREMNDPIVVGDIVYTDGDSRVLSDAQTETVESAVEEAMSDE